MNKNKILLISILTIFIIGISISCVSASSTIHAKDKNVSSISANSIQNSSSDVNSLRSSDTVTFNCTDNIYKPNFQKLSLSKNFNKVQVTLTKRQIRKLLEDDQYSIYSSKNIEITPKKPYLKIAYFKYRTVKKPVYKYKGVTGYRYDYKYKLASVSRYGQYTNNYNSAWKAPKGYKQVGTYTEYFSNGNNYYIKYRSINKVPYNKQVKYIHHYKKVKDAYYKNAKPYYKKVKCKIGYIFIHGSYESYNDIHIQIRYFPPRVKGYWCTNGWVLCANGNFNATKYL